MSETGPGEPGELGGRRNFAGLNFNLQIAVAGKLYISVSQLLLSTKTVSYYSIAFFINCEILRGVTCSSYRISIK